MNSPHFKYFLAAISAVCIWGLFSIPLRNIREYSPEQILGYRTLISLVVTWSVILIFRKKKIRADINYIQSKNKQEKKKLYLLIPLSGILIGINWLTFIYAVNHVSLKSGAFAYMVCPLITAMCGFLILKEKLSKIQFAAIGIALLSILISAKGSFIDVLWAVFIASSFAFYLIVQRVIIGLDKLNLLGVQLAIISLFVIPLFIYSPEPIPIQPYFWVNTAVISIIFTIIPLLLSSYSLNGLPSSTYGIIIYLNPIVAFAIAFFYFGERINIHQFYAYALLLLSVVLFNWSIFGLFFKRKSKNIERIKV